MHIIFIINSLESRGGSERVASLLASHLSVHYKITILSRYSINKKNAYYLDLKVNDIKFTGSTFAFLMKCKQYIAQNNSAIVIIHTMSKLTPVLLISGTKSKNIWSLEHISFSFHNIIFRLLRYVLYKKLDKVITLTKEDARSYDFIADKVSTIANTNPLEIRRSNSVLASKVIVSIGRLTYQKGYDLLIEAWALVESKNPNWMLHIYGEGEDRSKIEKLIAEKGIKNIFLKGLTDDIQSVYDSASFYVMSSRFEGLPVVLIEAQSRGLPIVSFDCPSGPAEIIQDGINGYLVENSNIEMLAYRIGLLIKDESLRREFSKNALISAKRFEPEIIIKQWIDLIENNYDYSDES